MVYNSGSPVMNAMAGMMYQQPFMPGPMGNIMNMAPGYNGMGGYYTGYNSYYNPYLLQQQKERQEALKRQQDIQNSEITKMMYRNIYNASGKHQDDMEEHLRQYDPEYLREQKMQKEHAADIKTARLLAAQPVETMCTYQQAVYLNNLNKERERIMQKFPSDMGLCDFFEAYGEEEARMRDEEAKRKRRDMSKSYNSNLFGQMVGQSNPYFNKQYATSSVENIDDLSIPRPESLSSEIQQRKMQFLEMITNRR